jgi:hypothetical protein
MRISRITIALFGSFGIAALLGGCAAASALPSVTSLLPTDSAAGIYSQTVVKMQEGNFVLVRAHLAGQCKGFSLLGFITIVPAKYTEALDQLYAQAHLRPGSSQTLAHLVVERSADYWVLFSIPEISVRADVVEFAQERKSLLPPIPLPTTQPDASATHPSR